MAEGHVCCGACGTTFNALAALFDQPPAATGAPRAAPTEPAEPEADPDETLEFDVPEQEWNRFFVDTGAIPAASEHRVVPELGEDFAEEARLAADAGTITAEAAAEDVATGPAGELPLAASDSGEWEELLEDFAPEEDDGEPLYVVGDEAQFVIAAEETETPAVPESDPVGNMPGVAAGAEPAGQPAAVDWAAPPPAETADRPSVLEWGAPPALPQKRAAAPRRAAGWAAGAGFLALLLAVQLLHYNRDALAADVRYGWLVRTGYERLDLPLYPAWPLASYEIRGAEAIVEERHATGTLDVVAQIAVKGRQPVGLPMVRLVLRDRWSNVVGSRLLAPEQFLPEAGRAARTYPPGAVIPVRISVTDPGTSAQGYELDVCLPDRRRGLQCQSAGDPFRRPD